MRLYRAFELADWGGPKPTWREVGSLMRRGKPATLRTTTRRVTNLRAKAEVFK